MSTYEPIASQTLGSAAATVTFSSLPQNYTDLILIVNMQSSYTADSGNGARLQFNGDTGSNYSDTNLRGNGSSATSYRLSNSTYIQLGLLPSSGGGTLAGTLGTGIAHIQNYSNSATFKTVLGRTNSTSSTVEASAGMWRNTAPITSITYLGDGNILAGSTFTIYGVAAGNSSAKASGGNIVTTDGSYWYHTFTSSGVFIPSQALTADYLVVAGGGGGGADSAGGGGAGGLRSTVTQTGGNAIGVNLESALSLSANTVYQAIVGAGGAGGPVSRRFGNAGSNSMFFNIVSNGGGSGGGRNTDNATIGGSGGGGAGDNTPTTLTGKSGTANQGYSGGNGYGSSGTIAGGGGGGAGAAGLDGASNGNGGAGGNGVAVAISGSSITYAGGGGGGEGTTSNSGGAGGSGGGGNGASAGTSGSIGFAGSTNTGGGGGGGGRLSAPGSGGSGGSGIVIIRYAV